MDSIRAGVRGKYLSYGEDKLYVRGVTYGTFGPAGDGTQFPSAQVVEQDFAAMARAGINAVRVYTPPPLWLLDIAWNHGLHVMAGLPWEQHIAFLDQPGTCDAILERVRSAVRATANHPAILCYVIGNEIPAPIVRWNRRRKTERFIRRLYDAVKAEAPEILVTYVNYPTTKYLSLPFLDFFCFNVYLETPETLTAYLAELQTLAGDRPLVMAEIGLDSRRNGEEGQSAVLDWQIRTIFAAGCAGAFVFAWTDEWHRGGHDIEDWDFGLTRRNRDPKPALETVQAAFASIPFPENTPWPDISVVVCSHNGALTLDRCLEAVSRLAYPRFEVILVDDGSTDSTPEIAGRYPLRLTQIPHSGLSAARNTGMDAARGAIIAYIDDDASPDPHWLHYLAWTYMETGCVAAGGPNIPPPEEGPVAECVANAPGGPIHVLITDREAEHIPGCNASFRKDALQAIGGFDTQFRTAGDDVDICWRLQECGWKIAFHAGAMVWHSRRDSVRAYWKQQRGYGRAEALLEAKWPAKYSSSGNIRWTGNLYGKGIARAFGAARVYQGLWGSAPFQRLYDAGPAKWGMPAVTIEWYLALIAIAGLLLSGGVLSLLVSVPLAAIVAAPLVAIGRSLAGTPFTHDKLRYRLLTAMLHITQPVARWMGRFGRTHAADRRPRVSLWPGLRGRVVRIWSEQWTAPEEWLQSLEQVLRLDDVVARRGNDFDTWDLEVPGGIAGTVRLGFAIEEHGGGKQMLLFRLWPRVTELAMTMVVLFGAVSAIAFIEGSVWVGGAFGAIVLGILIRIVVECATAGGALDTAVQGLSRRKSAATGQAGGIVYLGSESRPNRTASKGALGASASPSP